MKHFSTLLSLAGLSLLMVAASAWADEAPVVSDTPQQIRDRVQARDGTGDAARVRDRVRLADGSGAGAEAAKPTAVGPNFVDKDGDGICDNAQVNAKAKAKAAKGQRKGGGAGNGSGAQARHKGAGFVDANGDGVCDRYGTGKGNGGAGKGKGGR